MTGSTDSADAFANHDAFEADGSGYRLTTTVLDGHVEIDEGEPPTYRVRVTAPTLDAAAVDDVGDVVSLDWFETLERRLEDAPKATRVAVSLDRFETHERDEQVVVLYEFQWANAKTAADVAKTFVEYAEGTYVEGIVPGYEYRSPVADLLSAASQGEEQGGTPL